jgi:hypothetical protein
MNMQRWASLLLLAPLAPLFPGGALVYAPFARASGLTRLIERYATQADCGPERRTGQTVKVGVVRWRRCVTFCASAAGLYLQVNPFGKRYPAVLIPWTDLRPLRETLLYWGRAMALDAGPGVAEITVPQRLWLLMEPFMRTA